MEPKTLLAVLRGIIRRIIISGILFEVPAVAIGLFFSKALRLILTRASTDITGHPIAGDNPGLSLQRVQPKLGTGANSAYLRGDPC